MYSPPYEHPRRRRHARLVETVRFHRRPYRSRSDRAARRHLRLSRTERRGQDDDAPPADGLHPADERKRRHLRYLVPAEALYPDLSGAAQLDYAAHLSGRPPVLRQRLLEALELSRADLGRKLGAYSKGMRQKLALVAALQTDPALLILDEPSDGLDPLIQRAFETVLREARDRGRTIFMSSHDLAEVERVCEMVAIVREGRLVAEERIAELQRRRRRIARIDFAGPVPAALAAVPGCSVIARNGHWVEATVDGDVGPLLAFLATQPVADLTLAPPRLDDIFMGFYDGAAPAEPAAAGRAAR
jgi:ABC-2 type transport system ATP-binding protein